MLVCACTSIFLGSTIKILFSTWQATWLLDNLCLSIDQQRHTQRVTREKEREGAWGPGRLWWERRGGFAQIPHNFFCSSVFLFSSCCCCWRTALTAAQLLLTCVYVLLSLSVFLCSLLPVATYCCCFCCCCCCLSESLKALRDNSQATWNCFLLLLLLLRLRRLRCCCCRLLPSLAAKVKLYIGLFFSLEFNLVSKLFVGFR